LKPWNDPVWWAFAVLNAHEKNLPQPKSTTWLDLAKNEFNELMTSWDNTTCGGGLLRLRQPNESGYDYKNSITNGGGVLLAARLYRITRNETYAASANRLFDWLEATTLVDLPKGAVYDGIDKTSATACSAIDRTRWSYNVGQLVYAAANMADASGEPYSPERQKWQLRMRRLANGTDYFHTPTPDAGRVLAEMACEGGRACDENAVVFKGLFARWMAKSLALHPGVADPWWRVRDVLRYSAKAAADSFKPGPGATCFGKWYGPAGAESSGSWPKTRAAGDPSAGECLVTLGVVQSLLDLSDQDFYGPEMFP
jgi:mannan endo-1,6-alpha-mannosidase